MADLALCHWECWVCGGEIDAETYVGLRVGVAQREIPLCPRCYDQFDGQQGITRQVGDYVFTFRWFGLDVQAFDPFDDLRPVDLEQALQRVYDDD